MTAIIRPAPPAEAITGIETTLDTPDEIAEEPVHLTEGPVAGVISDPPDAARATRGSGLLSDPAQFTSSIQWAPRDNQRLIARRAAAHFAKCRRGIFRLDTGEGKTPTFGFIVRELRKRLPDAFERVPVIMASHQWETASDLAFTMMGMFPGEKVVLLKGGTEPKDLRGAKFVVGTYSQIAQETTSDMLKRWVGPRSALFVLDEADLVVYKGHREDGRRNPSWIRTLVDFNIFRIGRDKFRYNPRTRHYLLGASATLDRPDGIPLSSVWGPGNSFYHTPMAEGVRRGTLVPVIGYVVEMDVPPEEKHLFTDFTTVTKEGYIVVDREKMREGTESVHAVKTAVRAALDHMVMKTGATGRSRDVRRGIGFVTDTAALEKHMRWQRDLFLLVETTYQIHIEFENLTIPQVIQLLGGEGALGTPDDPIGSFGVELKRFLYSKEWKAIVPQYYRAMSSLRQGRREDIAEFFAALYKTLNVEARAIRGRPLVASAVWQEMDFDDKGRRIPNGAASGRYRNLFGDRDATFAAFKRGEIDMIWSIGMLGRGFNYRMASLIVDNSPSHSRREVVQRAGRIMRPPNPLKPHDHSAKPDAVYLTVTPNLVAHRIDVSAADLARVFGTEMDWDTGFIKITQKGGGVTLWKTPDPVQLELGGERKVHLILVGTNMRKALLKFLKRRNIELHGMEELDAEVLAFDAGVSADTIANLLMGVEFPRKASILSRYLKRWGADQNSANNIMAAYHSDRAAMRTVYGNAWQEISGG